MDDGRDVVDRVEDLCTAAIRSGQTELRAGDQALVEVFVPLEALQHQEGSTQHRRREAGLDQAAHVPLLDQQQSGGEGEAAGQQDRRVDRPDQQVGVLRRQAEPGGMLVAAIQPHEDERAEEQDLLRQEQPHAGHGGLRLVRGVRILEMRVRLRRHGYGPPVGDSCRAAPSRPGSPRNSPSAAATASATPAPWSSTGWPAHGRRAAGSR